ncbi:ABC transporter permease [Schumannella sp. 10F1B-5-1]|uniref:ABC transporter permease n=1 Tax=Schumannella sp. 10F1B-5-1 TaxID=2590780 RepID=UPI001131DD38|nr:ABC transporter permease [Schumannella sp. 10F1B-5-1]TPW72943.1 ABC transporter permease [Schumannella sp. 10F1B-5-1]
MTEVSSRRRVRVPVQSLVLLGVIVVASLVFFVLSPSFLSVGNVGNVLLQAAPTVVAAVGMTFVIMTGGIDLSVGSLINLAMVAAIAASGVTSASSGDSSGWTYVVAIAVALACGLFNGLAINLLKVHPLLVTLGTLTLYRGIALHITGAGDRAAAGPITALGRGDIGGIAVPIIVAIVVVLLGSFVMRSTVFGRQVVALGGSERSARETGLPVRRLRIAVYVISALCAVISGILTVGQIGTLQVSLGVNYEFTVITAVIVGGTSLFGGKGSIVGTALGALLLTVIVNGLNSIDASIYVYDVVRGLVLVAAVLADSLTTRRLSLRRRGRQKQILAEATSAGAHA